MKTTILSVACLLTTATSAIAAVPINGWYMGGFGGYTYLFNNINKTYLGLTRDTARYDAGYNAGARVGYQSNPLRYEGELTFIHADLNQFRINNAPQFGVSGNTEATLGMANVYYDFPEMVPAVAPFVGVGLGYGVVSGQLKSKGPLYTYYDVDNTAFAFQFTAGLTYNFSEYGSANLAYRYIGTDNVDKLGKMFQASVASLGIVYRFNEKLYK